MKKLMIIASIAFIATVANAAQCSWSVDAFGTYDNAASEDYTFKYQILDLGTTAVTSDNITFDGMTAMVNGAAASYVVSDSTDDGWGPMGQNDGFIAGNYYTMVIWDNTNSKYGVGAIVQGEMDMTPGATALVDINFNRITDGINIDNDGTYGGIVASQAVPEPTSGILLLLGVAGLALKRKRA